jgi:hypothetical protein
VAIGATFLLHRPGGLPRQSLCWLVFMTSSFRGEPGVLRARVRFAGALDRARRAHVSCHRARGLRARALPHVAVDAIARRDLLPHLLSVQRAAEKNAARLAAEALGGGRLEQLDFRYFFGAFPVNETPLNH